MKERNILGVVTDEPAKIKNAGAGETKVANNNEKYAYGPPEGGMNKKK